MSSARDEATDAIVSQVIARVFVGGVDSEGFAKQRREMAYPFGRMEPGRSARAAPSLTEEVMSADVSASDRASNRHSSRSGQGLGQATGCARKRSCSHRVARRQRGASGPSKSQSWPLTW